MAFFRAEKRFSGESGVNQTFLKVGRYQNASEVLREGLRLVEEKELQHQQKLMALREAVAEGLQDVEEGRTVSIGVGDEITGYLSSRASELTGK